VNDVSPARFRRQIEVALERGFRFVPASRVAGGDACADELALTFDDGLRSVAMNAAPVLGELGIPWTIFIVSGWADGDAGSWADGLLLGWGEIEALMAQGAEVGSHSVTHRRMAGMTDGELAHELGDSRRLIEARLGVAPSAFAVPFGQSRDWSEDARSAAAAAGYDVVYAQAEETRPPGTVARTFVGRFDGDRIFRALLGGAFDRWEEWT
jgi:peptidoglycan/xylan/chitin deacetylase (PgdA/CDA1 family)